MATPMHISRPSICKPPRTTSTTRSYHGPATLSFHNRKPLSVAFASLSPEQPSSQLQKPKIELEFIGPKAKDDGSYAVDRAREVSGEKLLRNIMQDNKIELYATYGKVMNCGGGGSCGTCIVEILDGKDLLNDRTNAENRYLKRDPVKPKKKHITPLPTSTPPPVHDDIISDADPNMRKKRRILPSPVGKLSKAQKTGSGSAPPISEGGSFEKFEEPIITPQEKFTYEELLRVGIEMAHDQSKGVPTGHPSGKAVDDGTMPFSQLPLKLRYRRVNKVVEAITFDADYDYYGQLGSEGVDALYLSWLKEIFEVCRSSVEGAADRTRSYSDST